ncbi:MAG: SDR family oxidoreductase [Rhizomicrobium sp.]
MSDFPDKRGYALVTGAGVRIGAVIARKLAEGGWPVVIHTNHSQAEAAALASALRFDGYKAMVVQGDLVNPRIISDIFDQAADFGFCSLLVNSASRFAYDSMPGLSAESLDQMYAVNLRAPLLLTQQLAERLPEEARGLVINILDQKVFNLNPDFFSYTVMKCALEAATRLAAQALAPRVRVCGIAPGLSLPSSSQTPKGFADAHAETPLGFGSTPQDIAEAVSFIVKMAPMTGSTITVDGGQSLHGRPRDVMFSHEHDVLGGDGDKKISR